MGACAGKLSRTPKIKFAEKVPVHPYVEKKDYELENIILLSARSEDPFAPEYLDHWYRILEQLQDSSDKEFLLNAHPLLLNEKLAAKRKAEDLLELMLPIVINQRRRSGQRVRNFQDYRVNRAAKKAVELALVTILLSPS
ncbi:unnamed protein product [Orchesella dallaii]|uniref:Uncharacterized protein n=1 Tax=Orchesella dallaii TaxID=48710 RepID=A0ABP1Q453_9HEXA